MNEQINNILIDCKSKKSFVPTEVEYLLNEELTNSRQANAWQTNKNSLQQRADLYVQVVEEVMLLLNKLKFPQPQACLTTLWNLWLPLAIQLAEARKAQDYPLIQGILGGQGTGKTTLTAVLHLLLAKLGFSSVGISIDDLYKTYAQRQSLLEKDSRLIWRGPPGTHDVELGIKILDDLRYSQKPVAIPRFDKSLYNGAGDRISPQIINPVDIILFEGWFVGAMPVEEKAFINPPHPIITPEDVKFAQDMNENLREYLPLWQKLDRLMVLYPVDYRCSLQWRKDAEHKMIAEGKTGMSDEEIEAFVYYFWRSLHPELFITPLTENCNYEVALRDRYNLVVEIDQNHVSGNIRMNK